MVEPLTSNQIVSAEALRFAAKHSHMPIMNLAADEIERLQRERDEYDAAIADVREILAEFNSEDVQVMARRAIEERDRLRELLSRLPDLVHDFKGHVPGDHALKLAESAGVAIPQETYAIVNRLAFETSDWTCPQCQQLNAAWASDCGRCGKHQGL